MKLLILALLMTLAAPYANAGEQTTKVHRVNGKTQVDVAMDEIGDNFFDVSVNSAKKSYANNSSNPANKNPATVTAVLDENVGVLAVVGLNIANKFTMQETTLVSVPKTYVHKRSSGAAPGDATFSANLTGPATEYKNLLVKCSLHSSI